MLSSAAVAAAAYLGVDFTYIHSHFLQLAVASFIISTLLSVYLYVRSLHAAPAELALGGSSGKTSLMETLLSEGVATPNVDRQPTVCGFSTSASTSLTCGLMFVPHLNVIDHL